MGIGMENRWRMKVGLSAFGFRGAERGEGDQRKGGERSFDSWFYYFGTGNFYGKNVLRVYGIPIVSLQEPGSGRASERVVRHDCRPPRQRSRHSMLTAL